MIQLLEAPSMLNKDLFKKSRYLARRIPVLSTADVIGMVVSSQPDKEQLV